MTVSLYNQGSRWYVANACRSVDPYGTILTGLQLTCDLLGAT
jgi:hypothetical protein